MLEKNYRKVFVASKDYANKEIADYICDGINDEIEIQEAINDVCKTGGAVVLSSGTFFIDSFPHKDDQGRCALCVPQLGGYFRFYGDSFYNAEAEFSKDYNFGTLIKVGYKAYEELDSNEEVVVLRGEYCGATIASQIYWELKDFSMQLPYNQKKITCIDCFNCNGNKVSNINLWAYDSKYCGEKFHYETKLIDPAIDGCVGLRAVGGSNVPDFDNFKSISIRGFNEGFKVAGEHLVFTTCQASYCVYGWTFGNYNWTCGNIHPITLINCCDERNQYFPLFVANGENYDGKNVIGNQAIDFINFNFERVLGVQPGGEFKGFAREIIPGAFHGRFEYTIQDEYCGHGNSIDIPLWEKGSGHGFESINQAHKLSGTTKERLSYAPNIHQRFFDTDLNKMLVYENYEWIDMNGNKVD